MNELRMYVELLFEGKVLTADAIELKEEIYGNLVARYEDLVSEGLSESEALRRTKESITSIDDVLEESASATGDAAQARLSNRAHDKAGVAAIPTETVARAGVAASAASDGAAVHDDEADTVVLDGGPASGEGAAAGTLDSAASRVNGTVPAAPVAPSSRGARTGLSKTAKIVIAVIVGLVCLSGLGVWAFMEMFGIDEVVESRIEAVEDRVEDTVTNATGAGDHGSVGSDVSTELDRSILAVNPAELKSYVGLAVTDADQLIGLLSVLPLGADYAQSVAGSAAGDAVSFELMDIPDARDDDAIERVLAFDAMALFTVLPDVSQVHIGVQEQGERAADRDLYVFDRETMEVRCHAFPADHAGGFSPDLLDDATAWSALVKECTAARFYDEVCELAERS